MNFDTNLQILVFVTIALLIGHYFVLKLAGWVLHTVVGKIVFLLATSILILYFPEVKAWTSYLIQSTLGFMDLL